jgi:pyridoxine 5-phosphate synthase
MTTLSINVNKIATLRNSRGGEIPSVLQAVDVCLSAGARGITVHPREDQRHIRPQDVVDIAGRLAPLRGSVELNIEGDARLGLIDLATSVRPDQFTLVPVVQGEVTSQAGWSASTPPDQVMATVERLRSAGIRVSLFVDPIEAAVRWAKSMGADRVELFTEPFAKAFAKGAPARSASFSAYAAAARLAHALGLGVNAGHDLDLDNLVLFRTLPYLDEVSIGHALVSHALWVGLDRAVRDYLQVLQPVA